MKLRSLALNQFKKFTTPTRLDGIEDGLNVVVGPNEMGKSTLLDALRAALFEKYSSKAQPIAALQNDRNQAGPVVEVAFELDDGLYRIAKRFIKKPYARLSCPDGRTLEGDAAEDKLRQLLGFDEPGKAGAKPETLGMWNVLWVQQGQSFGSLDLPESARSNLHSALESEVGTVLGGRRGRALPQAIEKQLGELVTSSTSRPRGAYKDLIDRAASLQDELEDLRRRRQELSQTLDELEEAQDNLARLSSGDRDQADQKELDDARKRYSRLSELETRIKAAASDLELEKRNLEQAQQARRERTRLKETIESESEGCRGRRKCVSTKCVNRRRKPVHSAMPCSLPSSEAEAAVTKADEAVSRQRRILATVERQARIQQLEAQCEKARAAESVSGRRSRGPPPYWSRTMPSPRSVKLQRAWKLSKPLSAAATRVTFDMTLEALEGMRG
ncbi:MAG: AAA family ATPase [Halofilum sp. (in: g-proteobacteria)]|nr:AAA family ATPase [Halofilum sp. (in: g-proteobacteria)]